MQAKLLQLSEMKEIYKDTPEVTVYGNAGGLVARQLSYYRATVKEAAKLRIQLQQMTAVVNSKAV